MQRSTLLFQKHLCSLLQSNQCQTFTLKLNLRVGCVGLCWEQHFCMNSLPKCEPYRHNNDHDESLPARLNLILSPRSIFQQRLCTSWRQRRSVRFRHTRSLGCLIGPGRQPFCRLGQGGISPWLCARGDQTARRRCRRPSQGARGDLRTAASRVSPRFIVFAAGRFWLRSNQISVNSLLLR